MSSNASKLEYGDNGFVDVRMRMIRAAWATLKGPGDLG